MTVTAQSLKGLFYRLVREVGGVEAAASYLNVCHQRVSQLQGSSSSDMPTLMQVATLEEACGKAIVTGAMAAQVGPAEKTFTADQVVETVRKALEQR